ncbi:hypothetical protein [Noviherbaspirillum aerium]|uniref:hypothetical protein n=1 Tax=Noviherbaspirillum aerium TaxID=2588497 RepID=UPI00124D7969|nr:hypothetical protein [Noviherbaspirillum aerium]
MNLDAQPPRIPDSADQPTVDLSAGSMESSPLHAPNAAPPEIPESLQPPDFMPPALGGPDDDPGKPPLPAQTMGNAAVDEAHQPPSATIVEELAPFDPAVIAALAADPARRRELEHMQSLARNMFHATVDKVYAMLPSRTATRSATPLPKEPANIRRLMVAQRQAEMLSAERRAVAEGIVVGCLINVDNPQWDPMVPETGKAQSQSAMATLLRMEL